MVGCGFTGAALIIHLVRSVHCPLEFEVIEPADELGRGIAYGAADPCQRINVPLERMSLFPHDPWHAMRWLFDRGAVPADARGANAGYHYVSRSDYGAYVRSVLRQTLADAGRRVRLRHNRAVAKAVRRNGAQWLVELDDGRTVAGDYAAMCFGHARPRAPFPVSAEAAGSPHLIADPWHADGLPELGKDASILLVGMGLTMADMVESLLSRGHRGAITAVSRHGLLAQPQGLFGVDFDLLDGAGPPASALALLRLLRERARDAEHQGLGWQPVADALRANLARIWPALPVLERQRMVKRLLPYWDAHRFRMAPQVHATIARAISTGQLVLQKASVLSIDKEGELLTANLKLAGSMEKRSFGAMVLCIGPDTEPARRPLVRSLLARGLARRDPVGLGLEVDSQSCLVGGDGRVERTLLALGPMTRGTFGEMTGVPEIARQVAVVASGLARRTEMLASA
ncbi:MAG: FAD/NAD(P)-binding protein [Parvibaculaceae bacterium]